MNQNQLNIAQKTWGHSCDIWLEKNRIYTPDGYITDNANDIKKSKHTGEHRGFFYFSKRRQTTPLLTNIINEIVEERDYSSPVLVVA